MAEMDDSTKAAMSRAARNWSDLSYGWGAAAGTLGIVAGVSAMFGPAGAPGAAAAGVAAGIAALGSAVAGVGANYFGRLAADPPREDVDQISVFEEKTNLFDRVPKPSNDFESVSQDMIKQELLLSEASNKLLLSFERSTKIDSLKKKIKKSNELKRYDLVQLEAVRLNAKAAINILNRIVDTAPRVNLEWFKLNQELNQRLKELTKTKKDSIYELSKQVHKDFRTIWNEQRPRIDAYQLHEFGFNEQDFLNALDKQENLIKTRQEDLLETLETPAMIYDRKWYRGMSNLSDKLNVILKKL